MLPKKEVNDFFLPTFIWFIHYFAIKDYIDSISYLLGFPNNSRTFYIWFKVDVPGKIALPVYISPKIHPIDHISTAFV